MGTKNDCWWCCFQRCFHIPSWAWSDNADVTGYHISEEKGGNILLSQAEF